MAKPANGQYAFFLPPFPWPITGHVTDAGLRLPAITGGTLHLWSEAGQAFAIAPDTYATCDGEGHWTVVKGEQELHGTCTGPT